MGRFRGTVVVLTLIALSMSPNNTLAREAVVVRKGNSSLRGTIVKEDDTGVTLDFGGAEVFIPADEIDRIEHKDSIESKYRRKRAAIADTDFEQRYDLAKWLQREQAFDLALDETDDLIRRRRDDARFTQLRRAILADQAAMQRKPTKPRGPRTRPRAVTGRSGRDGTAEGWLTPEQINLIKVWETDPRSITSGTRVVVPRETMKRLIETYGDNPRVPVGSTSRNQLLGAKGYRQLRLILDLDARELLPDVVMRDEPPVMRSYRRDIHRQYVISYCGARNCHGADEAGTLRLRRQKASSERTAYTNFATLERYENTSGFRMIDRDEPTTSLLPAYGLSRAEAKTPHPDVPGFKPYFRTRDDKRFGAMIDWIRRLRHPLHARHYGIPAAVAVKPTTKDKTPTPSPNP